MDQLRPQVPQMEKIRILIEFHNELRKLCKIFWSVNDTSIYMVPYGCLGKYYFGTKSMAEDTVNCDIEYKKGNFSEDVPKVSIHESGQVHIKAVGILAGPLLIPPLRMFNGQHVATVSAVSFEGLPVLPDLPMLAGRDIDHIIPADEGVLSGRLAFYLSGDLELLKTKRCRLYFRFLRPSISFPLFLGIETIPQKPLAGPEGKGVVIISGWDPNVPKNDKTEFLYLRAE